MTAAAPALALTDRQLEVLDAIRSRDAVSPEYAAVAAGNPDGSTPAVVAALILAGLVERCYGSMLRVTHAGLQALLPDAVFSRPGWTVDGGVYRRVGKVGGQTYGAHVQLEATLAPDPDRPWRAYAVVDVDDRGPEWPPVERCSWHTTAASGLVAIDTYIDGLAAS